MGSGGGETATLNVAPLAGAWIEITSNVIEQQNPFESLPSRERGLKCITCQITHNTTIVAPLAGAWIEILKCMPIILQKKQSLPSRERGLKL